MIVGICKLVLYLPVCHSLKEKRGVVRKIKDRTFNKFKIPVAEVDSLDKWQKAGLGFSVTGNDSKNIDSIMQKMANYVEDLGLAEILDVDMEIINV
ncbi:MAG: DUF503 domain-containing protein [Deltaproteobacteria bacterium]|jgi:uncharacterized protein|nr:DUF503 domain-containing protein [Deltaproteobacteria bacterium]